MRKLGFGLMRLPHIDGKPDLEQFTKMTDRFLSEGFNYFDTSTVYGDSETMLRLCLTSRYPRERYILTNKLTENLFQSESDLPGVFQKQLETCGVDCFDYYLLHALNAGYYKKFSKCNTFQFIQALKTEGKVKHIGISFHDRAAVLEQILSEHPEIEVVQIQFNYADYLSPSIESKACYEVCRKHQKPVIVMEPVRGGALVKLPDEAKAVFDALHGGSYASYAIRYAASFEGVMTVLSGMSTIGQMEDNLSYMKDFHPLTEAEFTAVGKVVGILKNQKMIACTACRYCVPGCPQNIDIPALLNCLNNKKLHQDWLSNVYYGVHTEKGGKASDCINCGKCEKICPQRLPVQSYLKEAAKVFETKPEQ